MKFRLLQTSSRYDGAHKIITNEGCQTIKNFTIYGEICYLSGV